jgi:serine/threonine protein kinase
MTDLLEDVDRLRRLLLEGGVVTAAQLADALWIRDSLRRPDGRCPRLGEILVQQGLIASEDMLRRLASARTAEDGSGPLPRGLAPSLPPEAAAAAKDPSACLGKYVLLQEVGRGSSGVVYRAWDRFLSQTVALKLLRDEAPRGGDVLLPPGEVDDFLREARTAVRLRHPNIVRVYEVGWADGRYYISMDFVGGRTLLDRLLELRATHPVPWAGDPDGLLDILHDAALAIHHAHRQSPPIIHRDLKPGNILIDAAGQACVADFGLAGEVVLDGRAARGGPIRGTPGYMAPEQAENRHDAIDARTDVYGLGAVLYEMLCGRPPFESENVPALLYKVATRDVEPPSRKAGNPPGFPVELERICLRAMARERERRFASAREFAEAVDRVRQARRASPAPPRRRPGRAWIAAAAGLAVAAGVAWSSRHRPPAAAAVTAEPGPPARVWEAALEALRADPLDVSLEDLRCRHAAEPSRAREFAEAWSWIQSALASRLEDAARASAGLGPSEEWLDEAGRARSARLLERMDAFEAFAADLDVPFDGARRWDAWKPLLRRHAAWKGTWSLRVNVVPYAEIGLDRGHGEEPGGWTPAGLDGLEVPAGAMRIVLHWPSRDGPQVRVEETLEGLRHGEVVILSGRLEDGRLRVQRR